MSNCTHKIGNGHVFKIAKIVSRSSNIFVWIMRRIAYSLALDVLVSAVDVGSINSLLAAICIFSNPSVKLLRLKILLMYPFKWPDAIIATANLYNSIAKAKFLDRLILETRSSKRLNAIPIWINNITHGFSPNKVTPWKTTSAMRLNTVYNVSFMGFFWSHCISWSIASRRNALHHCLDGSSTHSAIFGFPSASFSKFDLYNVLYIWTNRRLGFEPSGVLVSSISDITVAVRFIIAGDGL